MKQRSRSGTGYAQELFKISDELDDIKPIEATQSFLDEIKDIQDLVDIGEMSQEEATKKQIELYDQAIAALQGVEGAEALILALKKERYALEKGITAETEKQLLQC